MAVLCGPLVNMMVDQTLSCSSSLHRRWTARLRMTRPFSCYQEFSKAKGSGNWLNSGRVAVDETRFDLLESRWNTLTQ